MKKFEKMMLVIIVCLICSFPYSSSFGNMNKDTCKKSHSFLYRPEKQEVINGEVISLEGPIRGWCHTVHMTVQTEKGPVLVHLTLQKYITDKTTTIEPKDKVEIKGSRSSYGNEQVFIAAEVKKENYILKIWDDEGELVSGSWIEQ
jgi:hypothetical protein